MATEVDLNTRVKFRLLPNMSNDAKRMSSVKKKTRNPKWMKEFKWSIVKPMLELLNLWVTVWDVRLFRASRLIGEVLVPLRYQAFKDHAASRFNLSLPYRKMNIIPSITPYRGEITLAVKFECASALSNANRLLVGLSISGTCVDVAVASSRPHNLMAMAHETPDAAAMAQTAMEERANRMSMQSGSAGVAAAEKRTSVFQRTGNLSAEEQGDLHVQVRAAHRLLSADGKPCSSSCRVALRPLRGALGDRTPTAAETNDPQWNHVVRAFFKPPFTHRTRLAPITVA